MLLFIKFKSLLFYLLRRQSPSASISFNLAGNKAFSNEDDFSTAGSVPNQSYVMPLSIVDGCIFPKAQINILKLGEEGHLNSIGVSLDRCSATSCYMGSTKEKKLY